MSCGEVHSQARELVVAGYAATLVATTLLISRSSLYYRRQPRGSRADRIYDEQIVVACGEKPALKDLVGARGFEPRTSCAQGRRATRLRYAPTKGF